MSTVKATYFQHGSSSTANIVLTSGGAVTDAAGNGIAPANRNLLYNGAMQVAQRGTSVTGITTVSYNTADRWRSYPSGLGTWTQTVENDAPTGSGLRKSLKMLCTTADASPAAADFNFISQSLEGQDLQRIAKGTSSAQELTASFWVKANVTGTYVVELVDGDNNRICSKQYTISASATWEKKTITFPADTTGTFDNDNAGSMEFRFWLGAGTDYTSGTLQTTWATLTQANRAVGQTNLAANTNNYWQITGVQLEVGPVATPFEFKSYGQELRECQRYYQTFTAFGVAGYASGAGESIMGTLPYNGEMRANPTVTITNNGTTQRLSLVVVETSSSRSAIIQVVANGAGFCGIYGGTTATASIEL